MEKFDRILEIYAEWAHDIFGHEVEMQWGSTFGCYPELDPEAACIEIGMTMAEDHMADLPAFFAKHFPQYYNFADIAIYTLCFLHECGHVATRRHLTPEQTSLQAAGRSNTNIIFDEYRLLPGEFLADQWANDYLNANLVTVLSFQRDLANAYTAVTLADLEQFATQGGE